MVRRWWTWSTLETTPRVWGTQSGVPQAEVWTAPTSFRSSSSTRPRNWRATPRPAKLAPTTTASYSGAGIPPSAYLRNPPNHTGYLWLRWGAIASATSGGPPRRPPRQALADRAQHPLGEEEDHQDEEDSEVEEPPIGKPPDDLPPGKERRAEPAEVRQQGPGRQEQGRADDPAIEGPDAPDDHHQEHIQHDRDAQRGLRVHVPHPHRVAPAQDRGHDAGEGGRDDLEHEGPIAQGLGPELIVADGLERAAERRVHEAAHQEEQGDAHRKEGIVGDQPSRQGDAQEPPAVERRREDAGELGRQAVLPTRHRGELNGQDEGELGEGERDHGEEQGLHPQRERADEHRHHSRDDDPGSEAGEEMAIGRRAPLPERQRDGIRAEAEEHGVAERDDASVADDHVVARDEGGEERDLEQEVRDLERRDDHGSENEGQEHAQPQVERRVLESVAPRLEPLRLDRSQRRGRHFAVP